MNCAIVTRDNSKKIISFLCIICFIMHFLLSILFYVTKIPPLLYYNSFSSAFYVLSFIYNRNSAKQITGILTIFELTANLVFSLFFIKWEAGFYFYILASIPIIYYISFKKSVMKLFVTILEAVFFVVAFYVSKEVTPKFTMQENYISILYLGNVVYSISMVAFMSHRYAKITYTQTYQLSNKNETLEHLANTDPLTGLYNRRSFEKRLENYVANAALQKQEFSLVMIDIDDFKKLNDTYGHQTGDVVLKGVSKIIMTSLRKEDMVCRWGGEEILIILPRTNISSAEVVAHKVRRAIAEHNFGSNYQTIRVSVTCGVSSSRNGHCTAELIEHADQCLYKGKEMGKNTVITTQNIKMLDSWENKKKISVDNSRKK